MTNDTKETKASEQKKEQVLSKEKPQAETKKEAEKSVWEKAAETISGDNKLMESVLKIVLSPIALLAGAGLIVYGFFKIKEQKEEIEKLKTENKKLSDDKKELEEDYDKVKKKYKNMKELREPENNVQGLGFAQQPKYLAEPNKNKVYHTAYLD